MVVDPSDPSVCKEASLVVDKDVIKPSQVEEDGNGSDVAQTGALKAETAAAHGAEDEDEDEDEDVEVSVRSRRRKVLPGMEEEETDAIEEPEAEGEEDESPAPAENKDQVQEEESTSLESEKAADPAVVPRRGPFFMHDTRSSSYAPKDEGTTEDSRTLWQEPVDNKAWVHDKFSEITSDEYDPSQHQPSSFGGRKSGKGRGAKSSRGGRRRNGGRGGRRGRKGAGSDRVHATDRGAVSGDDLSSKRSATKSPKSRIGDKAAEDAAPRPQPKDTYQAAPKWGDDGYSGDGNSELVSPAPTAAPKRKKATIVTVARVTTKAASKKPSQEEARLGDNAKKVASKPPSPKAAAMDGPGEGGAAQTQSRPLGSGRKAGNAAVQQPKPGKVVRYTQRKSPSKASSKTASTFVPSPSAVAAAYQSPGASPLAGMFVPPGMPSVNEGYANSPVYYDQNGQAFVMSPSPMGYPPYGQQVVMDPGSPSASIPMVMDQQGNPMMLDSRGNPVPLMDYLPQDPSQMYYPPPAMASPPPMTSPPPMARPPAHNASSERHSSGGL